ncbi:hypothetical protein JCM21714_883 [Gracilibacillus boraciitolerans JCM 21714]|uniref:Uncharacterized protein n=1 Tax=Gracilibacillus boraciitolerans JCM 21714 TaxID=1298598 RepID=W4VGJ4_9BACI|nr:DUF5392 family protein [Gracilibacillus boraciitolerans]GAE91913.1 hypothetical protein JCM21714_883 [Gracilibacillus boraciitolerans JCM 21714]
MFKKLNPLIKKNTKYMMFAVPLLFMSIFNLIFFLFFGGFANGMFAIAVVYALMAAVGMALYKESKHIKKKIKELEMEHMVTRIKKSDVINDYKKDDYISLIKSQPGIGIQTFMNFLTEENERKRMMEDVNH